MSTPDYDDDIQYDDDPQPQNGPRALREAKARAEAKAAEAEARATAAERRAVLAEVGATGLTPAQRALFDKGYDGPFEPDAVKTFLQDAGFLAPPPVTEPEPDDSAQAQSRIADAATGSTPVTEDVRVRELEAAAAQGQDALLAKMREHGTSFTTG